MQFLAPIFFAGLAALAIPVLIHLIQKERKEALQFPSLMFLRQVPYKSVRRRRIRNWFLFALRCLYRCVGHLASLLAGRALVELPPPPISSAAGEQHS